jgi:putative flippase GtrA
VTRVIGHDRTIASRFLRFALVGAAGFLVNEAALWLALRVIGFNPYAGGIFSFVIAATFTWWGNRILTFPERAAGDARAAAMEWVRFVAANGFGFLVNYAVYATMISLAPRPLNNPFLALAFGTVAGLLFNFTLSNKMVFREP